MGFVSEKSSFGFLKNPFKTRVEYQPGPGDNRRSGSVRMVVVSTVGNLRSVDPYVSSELDNFEFKPVSGAWASPPEPQQGPCKDRRRAALSCDLRRAQTALAVVVCHPPHSPAPTVLLRREASEQCRQPSSWFAEAEEADEAEEDVKIQGQGAESEQLGQ